MVAGKKRSLVSKTQTPTTTKKTKYGVPSLLDITAKRVSSNYIYQQIEEKLGCVPSPVLNRILYHAFPNCEKSIALYSSNSIHVNASDQQKQPFSIGVRLLETGSVHSVVQIGFHLSGQVNEKVGICNKQKICVYKCSISFEKNRIRSTECSCNNKNLLWCAHIVAVTLYRIRNPDLVPINPPISDSVISLRPENLQKLLLILTSTYKNDILPTVQELINRINTPETDISQMNGFPDPTAGCCYSDEENNWHIDDESIAKQIQLGLLQGNISKNIISLMNKVREMISVNDSNYVHLILSITDAIMNESIQNPSLKTCQRTKRIYDELQCLWYSVFLNPNLSISTKTNIEQRLSRWFSNDECPLENCDDPRSPRLLQTPLQASSKDCLTNKAALIEVYDLIGLKEKSIEIATELLTTYKTKDLDVSHSEFFTNAIESANIVFSTFLNNAKQTEAVEWALICLCSSWSLPYGEYTQNRLTHRYEQFVSELDNIKITENNVLQNLILKYSHKLYETMLEKKEKDIELDILPNHCFIRFLFEKLVNIDYELAFDLSLLLLPLKETELDFESETGDEESENNSSVNSNISYTGCTCHISGQLEYQQGELASSLLKECFRNSSHIKLVLSNILDHVKQSEHLFRLAKLCRQISANNTDSENAILYLNTAFELGVQSLQIVKDLNERKSILRWLVTSAIDLGRQAIEFLLRNWNDLFSPKEIANDVAPMLTSQPVLCRLSLTTPYDREQYLRSIRDMVIEACIKDPVACILFALTLSEDSPESFELVCQICYESSERFNAAQLFSVGRYLENKSHLQKAFRIGMQALKKLDLGALDSQHPAICDVLWVTTLASNLGIDELTHIVPIIENCIRNPIVLTEIAERCANPAYHNGVAVFSCKSEPLSRLVALAQKLFIEDVELKLENLTRKSYNDFTDYLHKIKRSFLLAEDGEEHFHWLIDYVMTSQKGKKKLQQLISRNVLAVS